MPDYTGKSGTQRFEFDYSVDYDFAPLNCQLERLRAWLAADEGNKVSMEVSLSFSCCGLGHVFVRLYRYGRELQRRFDVGIPNVSAFEQNPLPVEKRIHVAVTQSLRQAMDYVDANPLDCGGLMYVPQGRVNA